MSIHNLAAPDEWIRVTLGNAPCSCFHCGEDIEAVAIAWQGQPRADSDDALLLLHPDCAQFLAIRLIRDGFEAERLMKGKDPLAGIDRSLIPEGEG